MRAVTVRTKPDHKLSQSVEIADHRLIADEPVDLGGDDLGPAPHEWLLSALGACTSMTIKMVADRKGWPLTSVDVRLTAVKGDEFVITREVQLHGELTDEQRQFLMSIANKCPVHKTLTKPIRIETIAT